MSRITEQARQILGLQDRGVFVPETCELPSGEYSIDSISTLYAVSPRESQLQHPGYVFRIQGPGSDNHYYTGALRLDEFGVSKRELDSAGKAKLIVVDRKTPPVVIAYQGEITVNGIPYKLSKTNSTLVRAFDVTLRIEDERGPFVRMPIPPKPTLLAY